FRLLVSVAVDHDCPGYPRNLVGECNRGDLGRPALHQSPQPRLLSSAVFLRVADDGHCAGDEQPSQVSIALLGDAAAPILAAGRVLLGHQPDPGGEIASRPERPPVADLGNQGGGDDRADAGNLLQPPARLAGAMPGQDALLDGPELGTDGAVLPCQHTENAPGQWGNSAIRTIRD